MRQGRAIALVVVGCVLSAGLAAAPLAQAPRDRWLPASAQVPQSRTLSDRALSGRALSGRALSGQAVPDRAASAGVAVYPQIRSVGARRTANPDVGYTPAQVRAAYVVGPLLRAGIDGRRQSIVVVDSFGSPTIRHDLAVFDRTFNLRPPPALLIIHPAGRIPAYNSNNAEMVSWAGETTLDVEWAHAMAPAARIVLAETPVSENEGTSGFPQIVTAEKYAISRRLGGVISQSFTATEQTFPSERALRALRGAYLEAALPSHDVTVLGASGDEGATDFRSDGSLLYTHPVTSWPASDPLVTAVGGLDLRLDSLGRRTAPDRVWNDGGTSAGGGGKSVFFSRPRYQNGVAGIVGRHRGVPDISMSASCNDPVATYQSFHGGALGWIGVCGTSEATPLLAGVIALADQLAGHPLGAINADLYRLAAMKARGIVDVVHGTNTVSFGQNGGTFTVRGWAAVRGYDLSSGLGTIDAALFVRELVAVAARHR